MSSFSPNPPASDQGPPPETLPPHYFFTAVTETVSIVKGSEGSVVRTGTLGSS